MAAEWYRNSESYFVYVRGARLRLCGHELRAASALPKSRPVRSSATWADASQLVARSRRTRRRTAASVAALQLRASGLQLTPRRASACDVAAAAASCGAAAARRRKAAPIVGFCSQQRAVGCEPRRGRPRLRGLDSAVNNAPCAGCGCGLRAAAWSPNAALTGSAVNNAPCIAAAAGCEPRLGRPTRVGAARLRTTGCELRHGRPSSGSRYAAAAVSAGCKLRCGRPAERGEGDWSERVPENGQVSESAADGLRLQAAGVWPRGRVGRRCNRRKEGVNRAVCYGRSSAEYGALEYKCILYGPMSPHSLSQERSARLCSLDRTM